MTRPLKATGAARHTATIRIGERVGVALFEDAITIPMKCEIQRVIVERLDKGEVGG